jgi:hypothetical protein
MKMKSRLLLFGTFSVLCGTAAASSDALRVDFVYPSSATSTGECGHCWAYDYDTKQAATPTSDTVQFHIHGNDHERSELRMHDRTGTAIFDGYMRVDSWAAGTNGVTVMQTFGKEQGKPVAQLIIDSDYQFRIAQGNDACGLRAEIGATYRITALYSPNGTVRTWVNNTECPLKTSISATNYTKIGAYFTNSGSGDVNVTWWDFYVMRIPKKQQRVASAAAQPGVQTKSNNGSLPHRNSRVSSKLDRVSHRLSK